MDRKQQESRKLQSKNLQTKKKLKARNKRLQTIKTILQQSQQPIQPAQPILSNHIYRFKISLRDFKPTIWRRIEIPDMTLAEFHDLVQSSMGWENSHMHEFEIAGQSFVPGHVLERGLGFGEQQSYDNVTVSELVGEHGEKLNFKYDYDFGDGWSHDIKLEKVLAEAEEGTHYPRCIAGENACPPEDIGGVWGYAEFLEGINDPSHPRHDEWSEWFEEFDPVDFNARTVSAYWEAGIVKNW